MKKLFALVVCSALPVFKTIKMGQANFNVSLIDALPSKFLSENVSNFIDFDCFFAFSKLEFQLVFIFLPFCVLYLCVLFSK